MTHEQINIAIATQCGWRIDPDPEDGAIMGYYGLPECWDIIPDYAGSLDAMAEAEKTLPNNMRSLYLDYLYAVVCEQITQKWEREWFSVIATAAQRAEAFCRALSLWTE